jgi:hypothetical protein
MKESPYPKLQERSRTIAATLSQPAFYRTYERELLVSLTILQSSVLVRKCRAHLDESLLECAHGLCHCEAVARDAGAIVLIEGGMRQLDAQEMERLSTAAIIAGLLHDIKRKEQDHAVLGSIKAEQILTGLGMDRREVLFIVYAIRNHEAFKETCDLGDEAGCLVSDALYDADKFRWGPENFTTTLWAMVTANDTPPRQLHAVFQEKMKGIERIKQTFRTATGKRYGPEIIDQGITIGNAIYEEMTALLHKEP